MKSYIAIAAIFLIAAQTESFAAPQGRGPGAHAPYQDQIVVAQLAGAKLAAEKGDFLHVVTILAESLDPSVYSQLSPKRQHEIVSLYGFASAQIGDWQNAHQAFKIATAGPDASPADWSFRLLSARMTKDSADAFAAFKHLRDGSPDFISYLNLADVTDLYEQFSSLPDGENARIEFAQTLDEANWHSPNPFEDGTPFWLPYATLLIEKGQSDKAVRIAKRISDPATIIAIRADRRFDSIAGDRKAFDPEAAAEAWLAKVRQAAAEEDSLLEGQVAVARALYFLNRSDEALRVLESALAEVSQGKVGRRSRFKDFSGEAVSAFTWKAEVLLSLGRVDEGFAAYRMAEMVSWGNDVTLDLLLASRLNVFNRPEEALAQMLLFKRTPTTAERISLAEIRACTLAHLNRTKDLQRDLEYLRTHRADRPDEFVIAQICANDLDGAAQTYIAMLLDSKNRAVALRELQTYSNKGLAPYSQILRERTNTVIARRDVQAALAPVGRIFAYDLRRY